MSQPEVKKACAAVTSKDDVPAKCEGAVSLALCGEADESDPKVMTAVGACCGAGDLTMNDGKDGIGKACFDSVGAIWDSAPKEAKAVCDACKPEISSPDTVCAKCEGAVSLALCGEADHSSKAVETAITACCTDDKTFGDGKVGVATKCFNAVGAIWHDAPKAAQKACGEGTDDAAKVAVKCENEVKKALCPAAAEESSGEATKKDTAKKEDVQSFATTFALGAAMALPAVLAAGLVL